MSNLQDIAMVLSPILFSFLIYGVKRFIDRTDKLFEKVGDNTELLLELELSFANLEKSFDRMNMELSSLAEKIGDLLSLPTEVEILRSEVKLCKGRDDAIWKEIKKRGMS